MITRIVKLDFKTEHIQEFKSLFEESKEKIISQKGCEKVEILQDVNTKNIFFTYSLWASEEDKTTTVPLLYLQEYCLKPKYFLMKSQWLGVQKNKAKRNDKYS